MDRLKVVSNLYVQCLPVMRLDKISCEYFVGPDAAVIGSLRWGESARGPPEGPQVRVKQDVFLLDTEPRLVAFTLVVRFLTRQPVIRL